MTCYEEFPDYPATAMPTLPQGWRDVSWRQDVCPCYARDDNAVMVWIDYPDKSDREYYNTRRYRVMRPLDDDILGETDTWDMAMAMANAIPPSSVVHLD